MSDEQRKVHALGEEIINVIFKDDVINSREMSVAILTLTYLLATLIADAARKSANPAERAAEGARIVTEQMVARIAEVLAKVNEAN